MENGKRLKVEPPTVQIKCVVCGHKETVPLTPAEPHCSKCFGPGTITNATFLAFPVRA